MFETIVVALDGSALAQQALPIAARLARSAAGSLVLFRAISPPLSTIWPTLEPSPALSELLVTEHERARDYLEQLAASKELSGIKVLIDVLDGEPTSLILALAQQYQASLIVLSRHGEGGWRQWMGGVALKVARSSPIPVLVLSAQGTEVLQSRAQPYSVRVLVPLDGSLLAEEALSPAIALTRALSAPAPGALHLASVLSWQGPEEGGRVVQAAQEYLATVEQRIRERADAAHLTLTCSVLLHLDVAQALLELAESGKGMGQNCGSSGCDALVMATHGRGGRQHWMMGSITERVLGATKLPLLIVRPTRQ